MFKITSIGGKPNSYSQKEYLLTSISDLDKLPKEEQNEILARNKDSSNGESFNM